MALSPVPETPADPAAAPQARVVSSKIFVSGLRIDAEIGLYAHEKGHTQPLLIDVELDVPATGGADAIGDTVNYELVGEMARAIAAEGHIGLVETFTERLARACLDDPRVTRVRVRVEKPEALAPHARAAGVEITVVRG